VDAKHRKLFFWHNSPLKSLQKQKGGYTLIVVLMVTIFFSVLSPIVIDNYAYSEHQTGVERMNDLASTLAVSHLDAFIFYYNGYTGDTTNLISYIDNYPAFTTYTYTLYDGTPVKITLNKAVSGTKYTVTSQATVGISEHTKQFEIDISLKERTDDVLMPAVPADLVDQVPLGSSDTITALPTTPRFLLARSETSYRLWRTIRQWAIGKKEYTFRSTGREGSDGGDGNKDSLIPISTYDKPATNMTFADVIVWLNAYSAYKGYDPVYYKGTAIITDATAISNFTDVDEQKDKNGYRLLSKTEWEVAMRWIGTAEPPTGSSLSTYKISTTPTGSTFTYYWTPQNYASGAEEPNVAGIKSVAWYDVSETQPTMQKKPNALGLYDMAGNVAEFLFENDGNDVVVRGGSYQEDNLNMMTIGGSWEKRAIVSKDIAIGFRIARNAGSN
jgi:hypothetical protein